MTDKSKIPLPAVTADSGPFKILDSKGDENYCIYPNKKTGGVLSVPLGETSDHLAIRLHEYGHLLLISSGFHTPELPKIAFNKNIDDSWFQIGLDVIVNAFLIRQGSEEITDLPLGIPNEIWPIAPIAQTFLRSAGLKIESKIKSRVSRIISKEDLKFLEKAADMLNQYSLQAELPVKKFFSLLKELQKRFGYTLNNSVNWGVLISEDSNLEKYGDKLFLEDFEDMLSKIPESEIPENKIKLLESTASKKQLKSKIKELYDKSLYLTCWNKWGEMEIANLPLVKAHPTRKNARKIHPSFVGAFRYPHRALLPASDGMAFAHRKKAKGGTILLDCSGSMNLNLNNIIGLLNRAPMLTIAGYASYDDFRKGSLAIFIKNGMIASRTSIKGWYESISDGNVVDGPAIRWLIKQARPRIWISDGEVTGIDDRRSENLSLEIILLKKIGRIKQYPRMRDCLKAFKIEFTETDD